MAMRRNMHQRCVENKDSSLNEQPRDAATDLPLRAATAGALRKSDPGASEVSVHCYPHEAGIIYLGEDQGISMYA